MNGNHIVREREKKGWTQQELAERADVSLHTVFRAEKGNNIQVESFRKIASALGLSLSDLWGDDVSIPGNEDAKRRLQRDTPAQTSGDAIVYEYTRDKETLRLIFPSQTPLGEMKDRLAVLFKGTFGQSGG
jgi:transcriptional regulator with XRE-family HTH domain